MVWIEVFKLEIQRRVYHHLLLIRALSCLFKFPLRSFVTLRLFLRWRIATNEPFLEYERGFPHIGPIFGAQSLHKCGEVDDVSLGSTTKAVEDALFKIRREGRRVSLAIMRWDRTEAVMLPAFVRFHFDAVML